MLLLVLLPVFLNSLFSNRNFLFQFCIPLNWIHCFFYAWVIAVTFVCPLDVIKTSFQVDCYLGISGSQSFDFIYREAFGERAGTRTWAWPWSWSLRCTSQNLWHLLVPLLQGIFLRSFEDVVGVLLLVNHADFVHVAIFLHQCFEVLVYNSFLLDNCHISKVSSERNCLCMCSVI